MRKLNVLALVRGYIFFTGMARDISTIMLVILISGIATQIVTMKIQMALINPLNPVIRFNIKPEKVTNMNTLKRIIPFAKRESTKGGGAKNSYYDSEDITDEHHYS